MEYYIVIFERSCKEGCGEKILMLCRASSQEEADKLALEQRSKYYQDWSVSITKVEFGYDNIAYMIYLQG